MNRPRPLSKCGIEELAVEAIRAQSRGGIAFARKPYAEQKNVARGLVLQLFAELPGGAWVLTMPGATWQFERSLLTLREGNWRGPGASGPHRTRISACESDRLIYHAAMLNMPGLDCTFRSRMRVLSGTPWGAERRVANDWICRFYFANIFDLMRSRQGKHPYQATWLDLTGPLSIDRLAQIKQFFRSSIEAVLVVTALKARWNGETAAAILRAGGYSKWIRQAFKGYRIQHFIEYQDGPSPMAQIAISKAK